jgi:hypothetical protein
MIMSDERASRANVITSPSMCIPAAGGDIGFMVFSANEKNSPESGFFHF